MIIIQNSDDKSLVLQPLQQDKRGKYNGNIFSRAWISIWYPFSERTVRDKNEVQMATFWMFDS